MPRDPPPSTNAQTFLLAALRDNIRLDGRALDAYRPITLAFPAEYGVADVRLGKTRVLAKISCEVVAPYADRKFEGVFTIACELGPMGSAGWEVGRQDPPELLLSRLLEKTIRRSGALDTESLCLVAGSKCFHVRADLHVLDHDGNLADASCLALVAALLHFRRPDFEVKGQAVTVFSDREREPIRLSMLHTPFCISTSYFDDGSVTLHDATLLEEQCREGEIVVSMNRVGEVCQLAKYGGAPVDALTALTCVNAALEKVVAMDALVKGKLAEDEKSRDGGGVVRAELSAQNERPVQGLVG
ncbi:hypothetical protein LTR08_005141 [Meristemomyces frigidus]|nr:hypothetical protein LTR08_005141 [Meristemomyces frigidus]